MLIDFGVARPFEASDLTSGVGTYLWRAPEVVGGVGDPGPASDAWGVGALAYWVLVREPPPLDSAAAAREMVVPAARAAGFPDPVGLAHHIARLLELRPSRRPSDLDRWADELGAIARRSTARRLAKPVAAGTMAVVAASLAAWAVAPGVARVGRHDSSGRQVAAGLIAKAQLLTLSEPPVALALAAEARRRDPSADSSKAVASAYDALSRTGIVATLRGHADSVSGVAFSSDGRLLASASDDHTVKVWDTTSEQEVGETWTWAAASRRSRSTRSIRGPSPSARTTGRSGCGIEPLARCACSATSVAPSTPWPSTLTAACWPVSSNRARRRCGTRSRAPSPPPSRARIAEWPSSPIKDRSRSARARASSCGGRPRGSGRAASMLGSVRSAAWRPVRTER